jgi:hypothetical protein
MEQLTQSKESVIKISKDMENEPVSEDNSNKAKTKLSFGISRILDDSEKSSDEQNSGQDINSDDDDEYRQTESPDFKNPVFHSVYNQYPMYHLDYILCLP